MVRGVWGLIGAKIKRIGQGVKRGSGRGLLRRRRHCWCSSSSKEELVSTEIGKCCVDDVIGINWSLPPPPEGPESLAAAL
jgi:hypothetical protein